MTDSLRRIRAKLEAAIDEKTQAIALGHAADFAAYKQQAGELHGLRSAYAMIDEVETEMQR